MANLQSAEGITRYLRSKDTPIKDLITVSHSLLDHEIDVYLPNRIIFVFDLLIDRLNDPKLKEFRTNYQVWNLFNKTWLLLRDEPKIRNKSLQSLKFGDAVQSALSTTGSYLEMSSTIDQTLNLVISNLIFSNLNESATRILRDYLTILNRLNLPENELNQRIHTITQFFKVTVHLENITKNFTLTFVTNALPMVLHTIESIPDQPDLIILLKRTIFNNEKSNLLPEITEKLLKTDPSLPSLVIFFKLAIDIVSHNDIKTSEDIFSKIIEKLPEASEELFSFISNTKRKLSLEFLSSVFTQEFTKPTQNWKLIRSILQLDVEISLQNAEQILRNLNEQKSKEIIGVTEEILEAFIRARDLNSFFKIWLRLLDNDSKELASPELSSLVSSKIVILSNSQLKDLIGEVLAAESDFKFNILNSIAFGLFSLKDAHTFEQTKLVFLPVFSLKDKSDELWKLKYQLLSLYSDLLAEEELLNIVKKANGLTKYQYFTYFRIREIVEFDVTEIASSFVEFVKQNPDILEFAFSRWFVFINNLFTQDQIKQLVSLLLKKTPEVLPKILQNDNLFEQTQINDAFIEKAHQLLGKKVTADVVSLLNTVPIQCYPRRLKSSIVDLLTDEILSGSYAEEIMEAIIHILESPTFKTKIETDIQTMLSIISKAPTSKVFDVVLNHHLKNIKAESSANYIDSIVLSCQKELERKSLKTVVPELYVSFTILASNDKSAGFSTAKLKEVFIIASKGLLDSFIKSKNVDKKNISWLLNALYHLDLNKESFLSLESQLKKVGKKVKNGPSDDDIKVKLFLILTRYSSFSDSPIGYFEALYIILRSEAISQRELLKGLTNLFQNFEEDDWNKSFLLSLDSSSIGRTNLDYITEIISTYWKSLKRTNAFTVPLFIKSLSTVSVNLEFITNHETLLAALEGLKDILIERSWVLTQYGIELILSILSQLANLIPESAIEGKEAVYVAITLIVSNILLHHRYRLSNRHHLILSLFNTLLKDLSAKTTTNTLSHSTISAQAFSRLLSNLCEPQSTRESSKDALNSTVSTLKRSLRKHLSVLLLSYISFALKHSFHSEVNEQILPGIYNIFDVLSKDELVLISTSLDYPGRTYYRSLYDDYKKVGKWQTD